MFDNFSLSFSIARMIHEHYVNPHQNFKIRFCQQHLFDRILSIGLSSFALLDISFHLAAFAMKSLQAVYQCWNEGKPLSFSQAIRHLKIAYLFRSMVLRGSGYTFKPSNIHLVFEDSTTKFVRALLLSGCPEVFRDPEKAGETFITDVLQDFLAHIHLLPLNIQNSMQETFSLLKEALELRENLTSCLLYSDQEAIKNNRKSVLSKMFEKIEQLKTGESKLIFLRISIGDPLIAAGHGYYLLVTKLAENYRLSILNRGFGNEAHIKTLEGKINADYSLDSLNFNSLKTLIHLLVKLEEGTFAQEVFNKFKQDQISIDLFNAFYILLEEYLGNSKDQDGQIKDSQALSTIRLFDSQHHRTQQKIGNCGISSLLGAISFHQSTQTGNFQDKRVYKQFIYAYKKLVFDKYDYLLDFEFSTLKKLSLPSLAASQKLEKAKLKLIKSHNLPIANIMPV